jgi:hypothetical protein
MTKIFDWKEYWYAIIAPVCHVSSLCCIHLYCLHKKHPWVFIATSLSVSGWIWHQVTADGPDVTPHILSGARCTSCFQPCLSHTSSDPNVCPILAVTLRFILSDVALLGLSRCISACVFCSERYEFQPSLNEIYNQRYQPIFECYWKTCADWKECIHSGYQQS